MKYDALHFALSTFNFLLSTLYFLNIGKYTVLFDNSYNPA